MTVEQMWSEYQDRLHGFIQSRVGDASVADDILQDVFVKIHARIDTLKEVDKIKSWMYQITRNTIIDFYRSRKDAAELPGTLESPEEDAVDQAGREMASCLIPMIDSLPDQYRDALTLAEIEGLTQKEVAAKQGISLPNAKARVQRSRKMLKEKLLQCCHIESDRRGNVIDYEAKSAGSCACESKR